MFITKNRVFQNLVDYTYAVFLLKFNFAITLLKNQKWQHFKF